MDARTAIGELMVRLQVEEHLLDQLGEDAAPELREARESEVELLRWTIARLRQHDPDDEVRQLAENAERRYFERLRVRYAQARQLVSRIAALREATIAADPVFSDNDLAWQMSTIATDAAAFLTATSIDEK